MPREPLPSPLLAARSLENGMPAYRQSRESIFVKQGKLLANYEDGPGFHQTLLLVVDGPDVLFLHYWGGGARSADVGAAAQARFAEYTAAARGR